jgi:diacylglycerol kinase family enzyme
VRWTFFINPASRGGRTGRRLEHITRLIRSRFPDAEVLVPGSAAELEIQVRDASYRSERLGVLGGDGTFSHALAGLMEGNSRTCALVPLHQGSGGDFLNTLGAPRSLGRALDRARGAHPFRCDAGRITTTAGTRYFLNVASLGLGGAVDGFVKRHPWPLPATLLYFAAALSESFRYRSPRLRLSVDGGTWDRPLLVAAAANGRYFGGAMHISPDSRLDDGKLDLVALPAWRHPRLLWLAALVYAGRHTRHPEALYVRFTELIAEAPDGEIVPIDVDGECFGTLPARIGVVPQAILLAV